MDYIDMHNHILPGVDDGSRSNEQSLHMLELAYQEGFRTIVVTPHYQEGIYTNSIEFVMDRLGQLRKVLYDNNLDIKLLLGCEIFNSHGIIDLLHKGHLPTIADTRYVLIEFMPSADYRYIKDSLYLLQLEGYRPILAHVERYSELRKDFDRIKDLVDMGILFQINAMSIDGSSGRTISNFTHKLLKKRYVHLVATDCHSDVTRSPRITKAANIIIKKYGEAYKDKLLSHNPKLILENQYID